MISTYLAEMLKISAVDNLEGGSVFLEKKEILKNHVINEVLIKALNQLRKSEYSQYIFSFLKKHFSFHLFNSKVQDIIRKFESTPSKSEFYVYNFPSIFDANFFDKFNEKKYNVYFNYWMKSIDLEHLYEFLLKMNEVSKKKVRNFVNLQKISGEVKYLYCDRLIHSEHPTLSCLSFKRNYLRAIVKDLSLSRAQKMKAYFRLLKLGDYSSEYLNFL